MNNVEPQKWLSTNLKIPIRIQKGSITKLKVWDKGVQILDLYVFQERNPEEIEWKHKK